VLVDLQLALFVALAALAAAFAAGAWMGRRGRAGAPAWREAPIGVLTLRAGRYADANAEARRLLALPGPAGELPEAPWRAALIEDARRAGAPARPRRPIQAPAANAAASAARATKSAS